MLEKYNVPFLTKAGFNSELVPYYCGSQVCSPGHSWGPGIRDHFLIHYIVKGRGVLKVNNLEYEVEEGQGFLICPNTISFYQADKNTPWTYLWVGFYGIRAEEFLKRSGLTLERPIFYGDQGGLLSKCLVDMLEWDKNKRSRDIKLTGLLYDFMAVLVENNKDTGNSEVNRSGREHYFQRAVEYICMNFSRSITIAGIARHVGIDRKYLHHIFKEYAGQPPQEFLTTYRVERACRLMEDNSLTISHVSRSVGYSDPLLFSKVFKKTKGMSPRDYRKRLES